MLWCPVKTLNKSRVMMPVAIILACLRNAQFLVVLLVIARYYTPPPMTHYDPTTTHKTIKIPLPTITNNRCITSIPS